ncbi:hypothetical protein ASV21_02935 [Enterobacter hormaechei subsp. steigerwaltii]|nr:hypothetical protein ASV21_02935 [Enterobacter hormaechei subsp. steigerwaltii]KTJ55665.1 hypothetical protein ASU81_05110 [Enterobacter hormaechei subsp. steigerwaltii]
MVKSPEIKVSLEWGVGWKRRECGSLSFLVVTIIAMASEFCLSHIDAFFRRSGLNAGAAGIAEGQAVGRLSVTAYSGSIPFQW